MKRHKWYKLKHQHSSKEIWFFCEKCDAWKIIDTTGKITYCFFWNQDVEQDKKPECINV